MTVVPKSGGNIVQRLVLHLRRQRQDAGQQLRRQAAERAGGAGEVAAAARLSGRRSAGRSARTACGSSSTTAASTPPTPSPASSPTRTPATRPSGPTSRTSPGRAASTRRRKIYALRLTTQLTPKNKLSVFWDEQPQCSGAAWTRRRRLHVATRTAGSTAAARSTASSAPVRTRRRPATTATRTRRCSR